MHVSTSGWLCCTYDAMLAAPDEPTEALVLSRSPSFASSDSEPEEVAPVVTCDVGTQTIDVQPKPPAKPRQERESVQPEPPGGGGPWAKLQQKVMQSSPPAPPPKKMEQVVQQLMQQKDDRLALVLHREEIGLAKIRQKMAEMQKELSDSEEVWLHSRPRPSRQAPACAPLPCVVACRRRVSDKAVE